MSTYGPIIRHYGIKGMNWGERRFQEKDGSLTPAGRERYADSPEDIKKKHKLRKMMKNIEEHEKKARETAGERTVEARNKQKEKEEKAAAAKAAAEEKKLQEEEEKKKKEAEEKKNKKKGGKGGGGGGKGKKSAKVKADEQTTELSSEHIAQRKIEKADIDLGKEIADKSKSFESAFSESIENVDFSNLKIRRIADLFKHM